jgi:ADP-L-glycero-D-manno-heptose 6-epimerase
MIVLTGAGGFIGSYVLGYLNRQGRDDIIIYDDVRSEAQQKNIEGKRFFELKASRDPLPDSAEAVIHLGANSNTLATDWTSITETNVDSTRRWYQWSQQQGIPMIYASSAAILGNGEGPLNQYAFSKQINEQECRSAAVLRLYNVYGPNEYHKGRMASTILHWFYQLKETGQVKIFEHSDQYLRDFVYVDDVARVIDHLTKDHHTGIFPLGTGQAVSFDTVADVMIDLLGGEKQYIPMPDDLRKQYQTLTCADTTKLRDIGVDVDSFKDIREGIAAYVEYLAESKIY